MILNDKIVQTLSYCSPHVITPHQSPPSNHSSVHSIQPICSQTNFKYLLSDGYSGRLFKLNLNYAAIEKNVLFREALMEGKEADDLPSLPMSQSQLQYKINLTDLNRKAKIRLHKYIQTDRIYIINTYIFRYNLVQADERVFG